MSAAGVQRDAVIYDDNFEDDSWDAVWESAVTVDGEGWTVEMRIPFSQLRFPAAASHTWGINARRIVQRKNEVSWLALVPRTRAAWPRAWPTWRASTASPRAAPGAAALRVGARGVHRARAGRQPLQRRLARVRRRGPRPQVRPRHEHGARGRRQPRLRPGGGGPGGGQPHRQRDVLRGEAAVLHRRGRRSSRTSRAAAPATTAPSSISSPSSSIRAASGARPRAAPPATTWTRPAATTILGAAKVTGRTSGRLDGRASWRRSPAARTARLSTASRRAALEVEPLTNYFVGRARRELGRRAALGFLATAVQPAAGRPSLDGLLVEPGLRRRRRRPRLPRLPPRLGGLRRPRGQHGVRARAPPSLRLQRGALRYYQRPDAPHVQPRSRRPRRCPAGAGASGLNKNSGNVTANAGLWGISPGFEPNDAGFATQADRGGAHGIVTWRKLTPDRWTRTRQVWVSKWWTFNYGRESQGDGVQSEVNVQLLNYWRFNLSLQRSWATLDDRLTRGGPTVVRPGIQSLNLGGQTTAGAASGSALRRPCRSATSATGAGAAARELNFKPWAALTLSAAPDLDLRVHSRAVPGHGARPDGHRDLRRALRLRRPRPDASRGAPARRTSSSRRGSRCSSTPRPCCRPATTPPSRSSPRPAPSTSPPTAIDVGTLDYDREGAAYVIDPDGTDPRALRLPIPSSTSSRCARTRSRGGSSGRARRLYVVWTQRRQDQAHPGDFAFGRDTRGPVPRARPTTSSWSRSRGGWGGERAARDLSAASRTARVRRRVPRLRDAAAAGRVLALLRRRGRAPRLSLLGLPLPSPEPRALGGRLAARPDPAVLLVPGRAWPCRSRWPRGARPGSRGGG